MAKTKIKGMAELEKSIKRLGKLPQKCVTKAARKGANVAFKNAKANAPVDEGDLKKGLVLKGEKVRVKGKKVYQVSFKKAMNDTFVKISKDGKRSYYPASMEYGYFARNGRYVPGYHYLRNSIEKNTKQIEKTTVDVLAKEIDGVIK